MLTKIGEFSCSVPNCKQWWKGNPPFCEADVEPMCWKRATHHRPHPDDPSGTYTCDKHKED